MSPVEIIIRNSGNTEARDIKALFIPSRDSENSEVENGEPALVFDAHDAKISLDNQK
jgi:hypothetical protein